MCQAKASPTFYTPSPECPVPLSAELRGSLLMPLTPGPERFQLLNAGHLLLEIT